MKIPHEMYKDNVYRVVHSVEEETKAAALGWSEDKAPGVEYIPITAVGVTPKGAGKPVIEPEPIRKPIHEPEPALLADKSHKK